MRYFLCMLFCLIPIQVCGWMGGFTGSGESSISADPCPAGTYLFYWDGDHPSGTDYACVDSGNSTLQAAAVNSIVISAVGYSGNGVTVDSPDSNIQWTITSDDIFDDAIGTVWFRFYVSGDVTVDCTVIEASADADNRISLLIEDVTDELQAFYETTAGGVDAIFSGPSISTGTWITLAYAWDNANDDHAINVGGGWTEELNDGINAGLPAPTSFYIGEAIAGGGLCTPDPILDEVYVFGTYKAASPF